MKKAKIWISACVYLLFSAIFVACSSGIGNPITNDVEVVIFLKQNIPKDYKIPIRYIPKKEGGHCWVELNVYHLEESLKELAQKFGNISTNRNNITIFVQMLQDVRYRIGSALEWTMQEFECHYREEKWQTERYFQYVEDFLIAARRRTGKEDCESPPCPTTIGPTTTLPSTTVPTSEHQSQGVEKSLASLLLIPLVAIVFLLVWKVRARRRGDSSEHRSENGNIFTREEGNMLPLDPEAPKEKNRLNTMEIV
ncbi:kit ligand a isoform X2 [Anguilla rostrata]|uniref:kit ligand a isoform X2 n=1 Tax=Anguilla anguilla TaxID=7936 RepID=UPI0015ABEBFE|nr:kit ligand a isoform X2 [Anguilla anguilla]